ncbi:MAG: RNA polymerase sigma factor [Clostridia bacterium]|nr:RNA polymerase sigma factor [Clostridia bacterium]
MLTFYLFLVNETKEPETNFKQNKEQWKYFETVYRKYYIDVYKYVRSLCHDTDIQQDAMQETWLCVIDYIDQLEGKEEYVIKSFILRTADYRVKKLIARKQKDRAYLLDDPEELETLADDRDLFAECESQGVQEVIKCIQMLTKEQRDVLNLYYLHHLSLKEIANVLNLSEKAVSSRLYRGRERLIQLLKERGF